jgi:AcrR family transcriptional regulator
MELVEEQGLAHLTMRALGEKLGVDPTAVYRHFPSKEAMIEAMLDQLMAQSASIEPAGDSPRDRILSTALDLRAIFHAHPQLSTAFATSSGANPSGLTLTKRLITELRAIGLQNTDLVQMYQTFETFIMGQQTLTVEVAQVHLNNVNCAIESSMNQSLMPHHRTVNQCEKLPIMDLYSLLIS